MQRQSKKFIPPLVGKEVKPGHKFFFLAACVIAASIRIKSYYFLKLNYTSQAPTKNSLNFAYCYRNEIPPLVEYSVPNAQNPNVHLHWSTALELGTDLRIQLELLKSYDGPSVECCISL